MYSYCWSSADNEIKAVKKGADNMKPICFNWLNNENVYKSLPKIW